MEKQKVTSRWSCWLDGFGADKFVGFDSKIGDYIISLWMDNSDASYYYAIHSDSGKRLTRTFRDKTEAALYAAALDAGLYPCHAEAIAVVTGASIQKLKPA